MALASELAKSNKPCTPSGTLLHVHLLLIASTYLQLIPTYLPECLRITSDRILMSTLASGGTLNRALYAVLASYIFKHNKKLYVTKCIYCAFDGNCSFKKRSKALSLKDRGKGPSFSY